MIRWEAETHVHAMAARKRVCSDGNKARVPAATLTAVYKIVTPPTYGPSCASGKIRFAARYHMHVGRCNFCGRTASQPQLLVSPRRDCHSNAGATTAAACTARLRGGVAQHEVLRVRRLLIVQQEVGLPAAPLLGCEPGALAHVGDVHVAHREPRAEHRPEPGRHDAGQHRQDV